MNSRCFYCEGEPEPGRIEMPNNGPIVTCPMCDGTGIIPTSVDRMLDDIRHLRQQIEREE